jgi:hypothetical protein
MDVIILITETIANKASNTGGIPYEKLQINYRVIHNYLHIVSRLSK